MAVRARAPTLAGVMNTIARAALWSVVVLALALVLTPRSAHASACCGSGHGLGLRLRQDERAGAGVGLRVDSRFGAHRADGRFTSIPEGDSDIESRLLLSWLVKATPELTFGLVAPAIFNVRRLHGAKAMGGGIGDITFSGRWDVLSERWLSISPTLALTLPTGRPASGARDLLAADATGLGAGELRPGITFEKIFGDSIAATFVASVGLRSPLSTALGERVHLGPRYQFVGAIGPVFPSGLSLSAGLLHEGEPAPEVGGVAMKDAGRRRTAVLLFGAYDISPRWMALASMEIDLPARGLSQNESARFGAVLSVRRTWPRGDHE